MPKNRMVRLVRSGLFLMIAWIVGSGNKALGAHGNELIVVPTATAIEVDGAANDTIWAIAPALNVRVFMPESSHKDLASEADPHQYQRVRLKAAHDGQRLYLLAIWDDPTRDEGHKTWVWNEAEGNYADAGDREDHFAIEFPLGKSFHACMLGETEYRADVWHWKACRTNPGGFAHDKHHSIAITRQSKKATRRKSKNGFVYIERGSDKGQPPYRQLPAPEAKTELNVPRYVSQPPTGSQADIRAKGQHDGTAWTLEMSRALDTGHNDDAALKPKGTYRFAIAVFDHECDEDHSTSGELILRFSP